MIDDLGFEVLVDHGTDEVVEAVIALLVTVLLERGLGIRGAIDLGFKTTEERVQKGALLVGGGVGELKGVHEGCGALGSLTEMLQMCEFRAFWRGIVVVALVLLEIRLRFALFSDCASCVTQVFLARNELVVAVQSAGGQVNACGIRNFCHMLFFLDIDVVQWWCDDSENNLLITY